MDDVLIGRTIGKYHIIKELGHGGMGVVYLAEHIELKKHYAFKILPEELSINPGFIERFRREARVMAALEHPNIVQVVNFGHEEGIYYLVMEHVDGPEGKPCSLDDYLIEQGGKLSEEEVRRFFYQICKALQYAHNFHGDMSDGTIYQGVIHRDLKPANILLNHRMKAKIADFGLAKVLGDDYLKKKTEQSVASSIGSGVRLPDGSLASDGTVYEGQSDFRKTTTGALLGTYDFMSPEQKAGGAVDNRSDIYALGIIVYQLLIGEKPVGRFKLPTEVKPGLDKSWDKIVDKCLQKALSDRFSSIEEIMELLDRKAPRKIGKAAMVAGVLLLVVVSIAGYVFFKEKPQKGSSKKKLEVVSTAVVSTKPDYPGDESAAKPASTQPEQIEGNILVAEPPSSPIPPAQPVEVQPPKPGKGKIKVDSSPSGAEVFLDDIKLGTTPYESPDFTVLPDVEHTLVLKKKRYRHSQHLITVQKGEIVDLKVITLEKTSGSLSLTSEPSDVQVFLSAGSLLGKTPLNISSIPMGKATLILKKEGYKESKIVIKIYDGKHTKHHETLVEDIEIKVKKILKAAAEKMEEKEYIVPVGASALDFYVQVLLLDPDNTEAQAGISNMYNDYYRQGESALLDSNYDKAVGFFNKCLKVKPLDPTATRKISEIAAKQDNAKRQQDAEESKKTKIKEMLDNAANLMNYDKYIFPEGAAAIDSFRKVLELDPDNQTAKTGIEKMFNEYYLKGQTAMLQSHYYVAKDCFNKCLMIKPDASDARLKLSEVTNKESEEKRRQEAEKEKNRRLRSAMNQYKELLLKAMLKSAFDQANKLHPFSNIIDVKTYNAGVTEADTYIIMKLQYFLHTKGAVLGHVQYIVGVEVTGKIYGNDPGYIQYQVLDMTLIKHQKL